MRYHVLHIKTDFAEEWQADVFNQQICELGVDTIDGEDYYIPSDILDAQIKNLKSKILNTTGATLLGIDVCPDENWNAAWESEHPMQELPLDVKIIPHCAFGAGHHETTSMIINTLVAANLSDKNVLDHGTGTGVLAIFAKRLGAASVVAVDIDEKSVANAKENAELNNEKIKVLHSSSFDFQHSTFDLILANIHRNILIEYMPSYAAALKAGGELWLSGFFESDCPILQAAAEKEGLQLIDVLANGEWRLMRCRK